MSLKNQFWKVKDELYSKSIENHLRSLYTWSVLLKKEVEDRRQWSEAKKQLTDVEAERKTLNEKEYQLANNILNYCINLEQDWVEYVKPSDVEDEVEPVVPVIEAVVPDSEAAKKHNAQIQETDKTLNTIMEQYDKDMNDLEEHIRLRRKNLEEQNDLLNDGDYSTIDETKKQVREDNLDMENVLPVVENVLPAVEIVLPAVAANEPPVLTPLYRYSKKEQEEILYNIFKSAVVNVDRMNLSPTDDKQQLINKESDRLLGVWMEKNKFSKRY